MQLKQIFRTVLVIGDNPDDIIKKYSLDTKVEPYVCFKKSKASERKNNKIQLLKGCLELVDLSLSNEQKALIDEELISLQEMSDLEFFLSSTEGCTYDKETGDAYTTVNPYGFYRNERTPQKVFEKTGDLSGFCNPFQLYDDYISYSAINNEIDWSLNHKHNANLYKRTWEIVVEGDKPKNKDEETIKKNMINRKKYFENFSNKEEYVDYSTSFWTYGVATEKTYNEVGMHLDEKEWITKFYETYIKDLPSDTLLTLYEVQGI